MDKWWEQMNPSYDWEELYETFPNVDFGELYGSVPREVLEAKEEDFKEVQDVRREDV